MIGKAKTTQLEGKEQVLTAVHFIVTRQEIHPFSVMFNNIGSKLSDKGAIFAVNQGFTLLLIHLLSTKKSQCISHSRE